MRQVPVELRPLQSTGASAAAASRLWAAKVVLATEIPAGRRVGIRIEPETLMFFDLQTRELLRTRPNPLTPVPVARLRGSRPAGP